MIPSSLKSDQTNLEGVHIRDIHPSETIHKIHLHSCYEAVAVRVKMAVMWGMSPYSLVEVARRFIRAILPKNEGSKHL